MNVLRPVIDAVMSLAAAVVMDALLQVVGLVLLVAAASVKWGLLGGLVSGGVACVVVGVAMERGR